MSGLEISVTVIDCGESYRTTSRELTDEEVEAIRAEDREWSRKVRRANDDDELALEMERAAESEAG